MENNRQEKGRITEVTGNIENGQDWTARVGAETTIEITMGPFLPSGPGGLGFVLQTAKPN